MTKCRDGICQIFWGGPCICEATIVTIPAHTFHPLNTLSTLWPNELRALRDLAERWQVAKDAKDWATSDRLRSELMEWGGWPPEQGWHPVFESTAHHYARYQARLIWPFPPLKDEERTIMDRAELQRRQDVLVREGRAIK